MGAHVSVPMYRRTLRQRLLLEGQRCTACGWLQFPPVAACPECWATALEPYRFSGGGSIYALTRITAAGAPPEFARQGEYHVAIIQLDDGPRITAQMASAGSTAAPPEIGQRVRLVTRRLYEEDGVVRYGFKGEVEPT